MKDKDKNEGKELQIFNNPEFGDVRTVNIDGERGSLARMYRLRLDMQTHRGRSEIMWTMKIKG